MAQNIITSEEVLAIAFSDGEYIDPSTIAEADITTAIERWVRPVVGRALMEAIGQGNYADLRSRLVAPAVALFTRVVVQPRLNASTSQLGLITHSSTHHKAADKDARQELQRALLRRAQSALRTLSLHLTQNAANYPEYDPKENILNRCTCYGGFVQIH